MRTHSGQIAEVHSERTVPDRFSWKVLKEVIAEHERVDSGDQLHVGRAIEQCCVVAYAERYVRTTSAAGREKNRSMSANSERPLT